MTQEEILRAFHALDDELAREGVKGEVGVVGGAAGCVAAALNLPKDWLNNAAKAYTPADTQPRSVLLDLPHLSVWSPPSRIPARDEGDRRTLR
jgi:hypothetical protein